MSILLACATSNIESPTGAFTVCLLPSGFTKVTLMVFFAAAGEGGGKTGVRAAYVGGVKAESTCLDNAPALKLRVMGRMPVERANALLNALIHTVFASAKV